jgi:hypothetical protein
MPGSWEPLNNRATFDVDPMLLLTDGSVMCHEYRTPNWHKLVPDKDSDYVNGTWHTLSTMPNNVPGQNGPPTSRCISPRPCCATVRCSAPAGS